MVLFNQEIFTHRISLKAEVANPQLSSIINLTHWIQNCPACIACAQYRFVLDRRQIWSLLEWLIQTSQGDHQPGCLDPARRPHIPGEPYAVPVFILLNEVLVSSHSADLQRKSSKNTSERNPFCT